MKHKRSYAAAAASVIAVGMLSAVPAAAYHIRGDALDYKADLVYTSKDGAVKVNEEFSVKQGWNILTVDSYEAAEGADEFYINFAGAGQDFKTADAVVDSISLTRQAYDENGEPVLRDDGSPKTEAVTVDIDEDKVKAEVVGDDFRIDLMDAIDPDEINFDMKMTVHLFIWDDTTHVEEVDNFNVPADYIEHNGQFERAFIVGDPEWPREFDPELTEEGALESAYAAEKIKSITYIVSVDKSGIDEEEAWIGGKVGTSSELGWKVDFGWTIDEFGYKYDDDNNPVDVNNDGLIDLEQDYVLAPLEDGRYAVTITNEDGFFKKTNNFCQIILQDFSNNGMVTTVEEIILNPSAENTYVSPQKDLEGNVVDRQPGENNTYKKGDVTGDGKVTVSDILGIAAHIKKTEKLSGDALIAADINGDGSVSVADILAVAEAVKKGR